MANLLQPKTQVTTSTQSAPSYAVPGLTQLAGDTMRLYNSGQTNDKPYPGSGVAPLSANTKAGIAGLASSGSKFDPLVSATGSGLNSLVGSGGLNATQTDAIGKMNDLYNNEDSNFQSALDFQNQKIADQVNRQFQGLGAYGGTDYAKALTSELAGNTSQALSNQFNQSQAQKSALASSIFGAGQTGTSNLEGIAGLLPTLQQAGSFGANNQLAAGALQDTFNQSQLDDAIDRWNTAQAAPRQNISNALGLLNGVIGQQKTTADTSIKPSMAQSIFGYLLGNAGNAAKAMSA